MRHGPWKRCWETVLLVGFALTVVGCTKARLISRFFVESMKGRTTERAPHKPAHVVRNDARLVATWVGHSTVLVQMDDKFILTDPVFTTTVGMMVNRYVEPGLQVEELPPLDAVLISHMHFDHLSLKTLNLLEGKMEQIAVPKGGLAYLPRSSVPPIELEWWESVELDGMRITATPVEHVGWRYGEDAGWRTTAYAGYVVEYEGLSVYFGGDTARSEWMFHATGRRFPGLDLALLPIAPIRPRKYMQRTHMDPAEALDAFRDLGARYMMPIHFGTFFNSLDERHEAPLRLRQQVRLKDIDRKRVVILEHGQQHVFL